MGQFSVAKYDLGKVRLKPMQSAVSPFTVRDLRGSPLETCRATVSLCVKRTVLLVADHLPCVLANICRFLPLPVSPSWLLVPR